jgi:hypothetical protein
MTGIDFSFLHLLSILSNDTKDTSAFRHAAKKEANISLVGFPSGRLR